MVSSGAAESIFFNSDVLVINEHASAIKSLNEVLRAFVGPVRGGISYACWGHGKQPKQENAPKTFEKGDLLAMTRSRDLPTLSPSCPVNLCA